MMLKNILLFTIVNLAAAQVWAAANDTSNWIVEKLEFGTADTDSYYCAEIYRLPEQGQYRFRNWCEYDEPRLHQGQYNITLRPKLLIANDVNQTCQNWRTLGSPTVASGSLGSVGASLSVPALVFDYTTKGRATDGSMLSLMDLQNPPQSLSPTVRAFVTGLNTITNERTPAILDTSVSSLLSQRLAGAKVDANGYLTVDISDQTELACELAQGTSLLRGFYGTAWNANPTVTNVPDLTIDQFVPLYATYWSQPLVQAAPTESWQQLLNAVMFGVALVEDSKATNLDLNKFLSEPASASGLLLKMLSAVNWNPLQVAKSSMQTVHSIYDVGVMNSYRSLATFSGASAAQEVDARANCENCGGEIYGPTVQIAKATGSTP